MDSEIKFNTKDGETVLSVDTWPVGKVDAKALSDSVHNKIHLRTGILPPVVRWISPTRHYVLLERPPMVQNITFHAAKPVDIPDGKAKEHLFALPLPWSLYAIELADDYYPISINAYALRHPVRGLSDRVGIFPISNHYNSGALCMPPRDFSVQLNSIADGIALAHRITWMSGYNLDMNFTIKKCTSARRPRGLFDKIEGSVAPLKLYRAWQQIPLEEVASWEDWIAPVGYAQGPTNDSGQVSSVHHLTNHLSTLERERTVDNAFMNLSLLLKSSFQDNLQY